MIYLIESKDKITKIKLGFDHKSGDKFQALVKKGKWFAAEVENNKSYSLVGCTLSPAFDFEDFERSVPILAIIPSSRKMSIRESIFCAGSIILAPVNNSFIRYLR